MNEQLFDAMLRHRPGGGAGGGLPGGPGRAEAHRTHLPAGSAAGCGGCWRDPWGYERRSRAAKQMEAQQKMQVKTPVRHLRWPVLAAAVLLLTVSVTGYALRAARSSRAFLKRAPGRRTTRERRTRSSSQSWAARASAPWRRTSISGWSCWTPFPKGKTRWRRYG